MIETKRLLLRPFRLDDLDILEMIYCDEEILTYTPYDAMSPSQVRDHLSRIVRDWEQQPPQSLEFAMVLKENSEKIGRCHILIDTETETGMIGWLLRREYRGQHYARESDKALIDYCFDELGLHRVNAVCNPENFASRRVLEQCGLRLEACLRQKCRYVKHGVVSWHDELEYAMLASERKTH